MAGRRTKKAEKAVYAFPLGPGEYFSTPVTSRKSVSRSGHVAAIRQVVGLPSGLDYDEATAAAVGAWQRDNKVPYSRVVDQETWEAMFGGYVT